MAVGHCNSCVNFHVNNRTWSNCLKIYSSRWHISHNILNHDIIFFLKIWIWRMYNFDLWYLISKYYLFSNIGNWETVLLYLQWLYVVKFVSNWVIFCLNLMKQMVFHCNFIHVYCRFKSWLAVHGTNSTNHEAHRCSRSRSSMWSLVVWSRQRDNGMGRKRQGGVFHIRSRSCCQILTQTRSWPYL